MAPLTRALASLDGLSVGDAFGDRFFELDNRGLSPDRDLPPAPWAWSDDTEMACTVVDVLARYDRIEQDDLAARFAERMTVARAYGVGALELLTRVRSGHDWRVAACDSFDGKGSYGNGAAMRVAPLGAYFADDPDRAAQEAELSAEVTHVHPEGVAGAVAVAVAAAYVARTGDPSPRDVIEIALDHTPGSGEYVRRGLRRALALLRHPAKEAAHELGNGSRISAQDTVPFCLWVVANHLDEYERAVRTCAAAGGDMDTTAAIVGGILGVRTAPPRQWLDAREPLPEWLGA
ncbi:ADP-ribosylglycohydrolase family protein [Actinomadura rupiterrae]|uniref:ADP-ribosylglycohydrolase family protein n=1 Tax=Actinomadura rupiterrae TaxID=559627 RepID=UPI0020A32A73|nr:ADP-ribosylglycohydrolase family protein [Actinomadura rupiterrae]MCP2336873.1 ADP-ribosylglycohydrolase [Actinomadura rupiterrae]